MFDLPDVLNRPYIISNENLRAIVAETPNARRVLTIAGSGDQALFYTLGGATIIDTFDIKPNARTIQDIKTTAIMGLPYDAYIMFMKKLRKNIPHIIPAEMLADMPRQSAEAVQKLTFCNYINEHNICNLPTEAEFARLQATLYRPFNFINADLADIHNHVTGPYDVINISNIFDTNYIREPKKQFQILTNLTPLLRIGGTIVYDNQNGYTYKDEPIKLPNGTELLHRRIDLINRERLDLFQRTR